MIGSHVCTQDSDVKNSFRDLFVSFDSEGYLSKHLQVLL